MSEVKNFDAAVGEVEKAELPFVLGGEDFVARSPRAGAILLWMRADDKTKQTPELLVAFLGEEQFDRIISNDDIYMEHLVLLIDWLAEELGGQQGNAE